MGTGFSLVLTEDGNVAVFGDNAHGQLGVGDVLKRSRPVLLDKMQVFGGENIVMVCAGYEQSACVTKEGSLWVWGSNESGESGNRSYAQRILVPVRIDRLEFGNSHVLMVAMGMSFSMILTAQGHVWTTGSNSEGNLGHGDTMPRYKFTRIDPTRFGNRAIGMIAAGQDHAMALGKEGGNMLWTWGSNTAGQLGHDHPQAISRSVNTPTLLPPDSFAGAAVSLMDADWMYSAVVTVDGVLWGCGMTEFGSRTMRRFGGAELFGGSGVRLISCSLCRMLVVTKDNALWTIATDGGDVDTAPHTVVTTATDKKFFDGEGVVVASAGTTHFGALTEPGMLYTWQLPMLWIDNTATLGHGGEQVISLDMDDSMPRGFTADAFNMERLGRWHEYQEHMLAFAMGTHAHLAAAGDRTAYSAEFPEELLVDIFQCLRVRSRGGTSDGFQNLLGTLR